MISWWGPVIYEYYALTETGIIATCASEDWLKHPGTVGRAVEGIDIKIMDQSYKPCDTGEGRTDLCQI